MSAGLGELASLAGHLAGSPVEGGLGITPVAARPGHFRAHVPLPSGAVGGNGRVSTTVLAVAADCGLGVGVHSTLPGSFGGPTVQLRLDWAGGQLPPDTPFLQVEGWALDSGPVCGSGRVEIREPSGALVATAVGLMAMTATARQESPEPESGADVRRPRCTPDTVQVHPESVDRSLVAVPLTPAMENSLGSVHGGVLMAVADVAQAAFRDHHGATRPLSLTVEYLRPARVDAGLLSCRSSFVRRGRRYWTVSTEVRRPDGTPVIVGTGTSLVLGD